MRMRGGCDEGGGISEHSEASRSSNPDRHSSRGLGHQCRIPRNPGVGDQATDTCRRASSSIGYLLRRYPISVFLRRHSGRSHVGEPAQPVSRRAADPAPTCGRRSGRPGLGSRLLGGPAQRRPRLLGNRHQVAGQYPTSACCGEFRWLTMPGMGQLTQKSAAGPTLSDCSTRCCQCSRCSEARSRFSVARDSPTRRHATS